MPKISVNGVKLAYEVWGQGTPVVLTPQGWFPRNVFTYVMAGRLSAHHQVLLWDRRNSGASEISIKDAPSELHLWADDLHHLLHALDMSPAYLGGASGGCLFSLFMAQQYPQDVKGLILIDPATDDIDLLKPLWDARYSDLAEVAESKGTQAVIDASTEAWTRLVTGQSSPNNSWDVLRNWIAESIQKDPSNRERILSLDPHYLAKTLRKWREWLFSAWPYLVPREDLKSISVPALVLHGCNPLHPEHTAQELASLLPNAELAQYSDIYSRDEIQRVCESDSYDTQNAFLKLPFIEAFLNRLS
jgi:pimeloyl-ACP methyl ester carboxylesterase